MAALKPGVSLGHLDFRLQGLRDGFQGRSHPGQLERDCAPNRFDATHLPHAASRATCTASTVPCSKVGRWSAAWGLKSRNIAAAAVAVIRASSPSRTTEAQTLSPWRARV